MSLRQSILIFCELLNMYTNERLTWDVYFVGVTKAESRKFVPDDRKKLADELSTDFVLE